MSDAKFDPIARPDLIQQTDRHQDIARLRAYYDGTQYDHRPDWWTGKDSNGNIVPLRERKPCVIYGLPKAATGQVVRFLLGDGRFPTVNVPCKREEPDEDDPEEVNEPEPSPDEIEALELDEESAEDLQRWIGEFVERSRLKQRLKALARSGVALRTAVTVMSIRGGRYQFDMPRPEDCWPRFRNDDPADEVLELAWCYEFEKTVLENGKVRRKRYWFRRAWDSENHYVWPDIEKKLGVVPQWGTPQAIPHGLGFCPVIWARNSTDSAGEDIDGESIYEGLFPQFDALNFAYSQRHRGIFYLGVPQPYETGVDEDDGPEANGRKAGPPGFSQGGGGSTNKPGQQQPAARRMAPDEMWSYQGKDVKVGLIETTGVAFDVATKHVDDIRSRVCEEMGVVMASMHDTTSRVTNGAEMSAKFLALAHAPLLALVGELRHCWWADAIEPILSMALRMCAVLDGKGILIPGSRRVAQALKPFLQVTQTVDEDGAEQETRTWMAPKLEPLWGRYFEPSAQEVQQGVTAANLAVDGGLVSRERGTHYIADDFGIDDVDRELEAIEQEKAESLQNAHDAMGALGGDTEDQPPAGSGAGTPGEPPANASPGRGNASGASGRGQQQPGQGAADSTGPTGLNGPDGGISPGSTG